MTTVAIVGAGPAGLSAAIEVAAAGLRPVLIDEAPRIGGQVYRQPPPELQRPFTALYGAQAAQAQDLFARWSTVEHEVEHRPNTLVWQLEDRTLHLLENGRAGMLPFDALVIATGATDRILPFPGWTLPGVFTLGGSQVLLKSQGSVIGPRVVFAGSGPLLYLVASQYVKAGAQVLAVLDTAPADAQRRALPAMLARPRLAASGAAILWRLRTAGVPVHRGVKLLRAEGEGAVARLVWENEGKAHTTECDAVAFGHGLRSETQLADLAGCAFDFDAIDQAWLPRRDEHGRTSVPGVYIAGDGASIRGADAAELAGARAARALLQDMGRPVRAQTDAPMQPHDRWREAMAVLAAPPANWAADAPDELVVCRCEHVTAGELRACATATGAQELNRLKAQSRVGMGRCQGRMCGAAAARLLAHTTGSDLQSVGRLRTQPPVKPVPVAVIGAALAQPTPVPAEESDD
ncbi:NAD(P)/FAD-dependent oxidoreductase [Ramlibacter albus]|uniref:NAD(P)/FAD-dependent oxidoreductase n=1 Tax=Ramlibacter albus TaxID=2079448 RepID=A0A923S4X4_9BURK|nr:FAD/NAD(P)-binding oxidoreductase [Ramlibacter albus]MBC5767975.1 NAD(P)/FAD-dependent oxidoreductase [Ramlibacter albus]